MSQLFPSRFLYILVDLISYFCYLKKNLSIEEIYQKFDNDNYVVSKLDINRIYRFIEYINGDDIL